MVVYDPCGLGEDVRASFKLLRHSQVDNRENAGVEECLLRFWSQTVELRELPLLSTSVLSTVRSAREE